MRDDSVLFGDDVHDHDAEVWEGLSEGADPMPRRLGDLAAGDLGECLQIAVVDELDEAAHQQFVLLGCCHRGGYMITTTPTRQISAPLMS